jgi:hypothetical protein
VRECSDRRGQARPSRVALSKFGSKHPKLLEGGRWQQRTSGGPERAEPCCVRMLERTCKSMD